MHFKILGTLGTTLLDHIETYLLLNDKNNVQIEHQIAVLFAVVIIEKISTKRASLFRERCCQLAYDGALLNQSIFNQFFLPFSGATTFSIITLSIITLSIITLSLKTLHNAHYNHM